MSPKHTPIFNKSHCAKYGLAIKYLEPTSQKVLSVSCRFCEVFGKDEHLGEKRKTVNVKYFESFRTDNYQSHLMLQHKDKWTQYKDIKGAKEQEAFFNATTVPYTNTIPSHFDKSTPCVYTINAQIVDIIVGELLFHPDDIEGVTIQRALSIFEPQRDTPSGEIKEYVLTIKTFRRFALCVKFLSCGSTFRMAAKLMQSVLEESGLGYLRGMNDTIASNYARMVCCLSLQKLSDIMSNVWGFSVALDSSTHQGKSYLDIRVRFLVHLKMYNFHMLAIPLFERHTAENLFNVAVKFLDAICPTWRKQLVGVSSDGDRTMTGRVKGVATRFEEACQPASIIHVWCGLHQLDLVMQRVFASALNEDFLKCLTSLISYLRRQQILIAEMRTTCPKVAATRWLSMANVTKWFKLHRVAVQDYLIAHQPLQKPSDKWWVFMFVIDAVAEQAAIVFTALQGQTTLLSEQRHQLKDLTSIYCQMGNLQGPLSVDEIAVLSQDDFIINGKYAISKTNARNALDLGIWVVQTLERLPPEDIESLTLATGLVLTQLAQEISEIVAERNSSNEAGDELPSVLPLQLMVLSVRQFTDIYKIYSDRFKNEHNTQDEDVLSQEFVRFKNATRDEQTLRLAIECCNISKTSFEEAWSVTANRFPMLMEFCGGLATAFPNTATVESDFSILGYEKDANRSSLTDFSLEGIFHAKHYTELCNIPLPKQSI